MVAPEKRHRGCAAAEGRQGSMKLAEESAKCSSRSFFRAPRVALEKQLRMADQHGFFQNIKSVQLEETKKVESQCVRDEGGRLLRDKGRIREKWVRFFRS